MIPRSYAPAHKTNNTPRLCLLECQQRDFGRYNEQLDQTSSLSPATCWMYTKTDNPGPNEFTQGRNPPTTNVNCQTSHQHLTLSYGQPKPLIIPALFPLTRTTCGCFQAACWASKQTRWGGETTVSVWESLGKVTRVGTEAASECWQYWRQQQQQRQQQ